MFRNSTMNELTMSSNKNTSASVNIEAVNGSHNIIVANGDVVPATSKSQVILNGKFLVNGQFYYKIILAIATKEWTLISLFQVQVQ